ncbi:MAG: hypothetical protein K5695_09520 [Oscillospiraceae bacterium]|nr:hypothetical protein [Oscillospiraceae bacterium]
MRALEMGIYDDLDTQTQPVLHINVFENNVIVFGGHMSGKTTFLKTLLIRMHQNIEDGDVEETYIIDFGGNLGEYSKLPMVAACFDNSNEENVRRIFKTVEKKLETNIKSLKSTQFYEAYHAASGQKPGHITLVIDNINAFLSDERYTSYQETLLKFCRDGLSKGLSVVFSASDTSNGLSKFLSSFGWKLAFDLPSEVYIDVFGRKIAEPMKNPGRGVTIIGGKQRELQAFLPFENEREELVEFLRGMEHFSCSVEKLQGFGDELTEQNFCEYCADHNSIPAVESQGDWITVGLDYYEHKPVIVDLKDMHSIGIYGKKKFGKTNLLQILLHGIQKKHPEYRIILVDDGRKQLLEFHDASNPFSVYMDKIEHLTDYLDQNGYYAKTGNKTFQEQETPTTVFVLQSKMLFQSSGKNLLSIFSKMTASAEEKGYYFIYPDIRKIGNSDREAESFLNNSFSVVFLLDNIAEFISDKGSRSVFGEMDAKELKNEYARCELGDGYFYDIESDDLKKMRFLKA